MKKFFILMISFTLIFIVMGSNQVKAEEASLSGQCTQLVQFLSNHIEEFQNQYNLTLDDQDEPLDIHSIEGYTTIYILDCDGYGVYIDFDGSNGYVLVSLDYVIYELCTSGDLDYLKNVSFAYYYSADGFLYKTGQNYERYANGFGTGISLQAAGQTGDGDGFITDMNSYVADRYPDYEFVKMVNNISNYTITRQINTSYYVHYVNGAVFSEGNCALNTMYSVLNSWQKNGILPDIPSENEKVDWLANIENDKLYAKYGTGQSGDGDYWTVNREFGFSQMPLLYDRIRTYTITNYNYNPEAGINVDQVAETINFVAHYADYYQFKPLRSTAFYDVTSKLSEGRAVFLVVNNSQTYNNHAMCVVGYNEYNYKTGWWIFQQTQTAYFYLVDDSRSTRLVYFDPNRSASYEFVYY